MVCLCTWSLRLNHFLSNVSSLFTLWNSFSFFFVVSSYSNVLRVVAVVQFLFVGVFFIFLLIIFSIRYIKHDGNEFLPVRNETSSYTKPNVLFWLHAIVRKIHERFLLRFTRFCSSMLLNKYYDPWWKNHRLQNDNKQTIDRKKN